MSKLRVIQSELKNLNYLIETIKRTKKSSEIELNLLIKFLCSSQKISTQIELNRMTQNTMYMYVQVYLFSLTPGQLQFF